MANQANQFHPSKLVKVMNAESLLVLEGTGFAKNQKVDILKPHNNPTMPTHTWTGKFIAVNDAGTRGLAAMKCTKGAAAPPAADPKPKEGEAGKGKGKGPDTGLERCRVVIGDSVPDATSIDIDLYDA
jgi:hypothetical protein